MPSSPVKQTLFVLSSLLVFFQQEDWNMLRNSRMSCENKKAPCCFWPMLCEAPSIWDFSFASSFTQISSQLRIHLIPGLFVLDQFSRIYAKALCKAMKPSSASPFSHSGLNKPVFAVQQQVFPELIVVRHGFSMIGPGLMWFSKLHKLQKLRLVSIEGRSFPLQVRSTYPGWTCWSLLPHRTAANPVVPKKYRSDCA